jgi:curved DNA-binding protein CbpA
VIGASARSLDGRRRDVARLARVHPDHYLALGLRPDATDAEVRAAYLRVMRVSHPDRRPGDLTAEETARAANAAWEVLGDAARRGAYDRLRHQRPDGTSAYEVKVLRSDEEEARLAAYRATGAEFARQFHVASVRVASGVFLVGLLLLLLAAG